jgi:hypothetical protein
LKAHKSKVLKIFVARHKNSFSSLKYKVKFFLYALDEDKNIPDWIGLDWVGLLKDMLG